MAYLMGIDLGTSSLKTLVVDENGTVAAEASEAYQFDSPKGGYSEQDPEVWWGACVRTIRQCLTKVKADEVKALSFSGQMHGAVLLDRDNQVIRPAILHNDARSSAQVAMLKELFGTVGVKKHMMNAVYTGFLLPSLLWIRENEAKVYERAGKVCLPKDYLKLRLTGDVSSDISDASATLAYDIRNNCWSQEILDQVQVPMSLFPKLYETADAVGHVSRSAAEQTGLSESTIVVAGGAMGSVVGALPGAGATIASWIAYSETKMFCKNNETFGTGDIRGVAAPESANNGVPAGGLIPLLALGIPGSNSTAILMVGFSLAGISCGPMLFLTQPQIPYGLMASMFMAQIVLIFVGLLMLRPCVYITSIKKIFLTSAIMMFAFIGAFSTTNDVYSIILVVIFGLIGFAMKELGFAPAATVLGFVLGELVEGNLRRTMQMSRGSMDIFFAGGLNKFFIALTILGVLFPYISKWLAARRKAKAAA